MKYIYAEKLIAEIERRKNESRELAQEHKNSSLGNAAQTIANEDEEILSLIMSSLQQEQPETEMKSPFTGGKVAILSREEEVTFRGERINVTRKYYRCEDTGREFTDSKLDDDMMWAVFRAYCEKKGITSFTDIMLKQEQPEETCKTCGFYENNCPFIRGKLIPYPNKVCKDYIYSVMKQQEQPEVDLEKEISKWLEYGDITDTRFGDYDDSDIERTARHFAEWGAIHLNSRKEE